MNLRVICQLCGKTAILNTNEIRHDKWDYFTADRFFDDSDQESDWEFWLCSKCLELKGIAAENAQEWKGFQQSLYEIKK